MRKFWIVLLSLALVMAFTMPVFAAAVNFSGSYVAQGIYENNRKLTDPGNTSISDVWQRLRLQTVFVVQEGLTLTTRFDALEKVWGATRSTTTTATDSGTINAEAENIKFEYAFVTINSSAGIFNIGYMMQGTWGTVFANTGEQDYGSRVKWDLETAPFFWGARWDKTEGKKTSIGTIADHEYDKYSVLGGYKWRTGEAALQITYYLDSSTADNPTTGYKARYWQFQPYAKAKFGIVYLEAELGFLAGKDREYNSANSTTQLDRNITGWRGYFMANVDLAPAYVGGMVFYASGDDPNTTDKNEGGAKIGTDFTPCLILFDYDGGRWHGSVGANNNGVTLGANGDNVLAYQIFGGFKPTPKLNIKGSLTNATMDKVQVANQYSKDIGYEFDVTATYKIYDNLSYMLGFGYLWAGDAFKGTNAGNKISNDYLLTHKLTLVF